MKTFIHLYLLCLSLAFFVQSANCQDSSSYFLKIPPSLEKNSEEWLKEAIAHYDGGRYLQCTEALNNALKVNDNASLTDVLYYYKALAYIMLKDRTAAIAELDTAIILNRTKDNYFYLRGDLHLLNGNFAKAEPDTRQAVELNPQNEGAKLNLGLIYQKMGSYEQALAFYDNVLEMNPKNKNAYYLRGLLWLQVGMPEKGCEDLKKGEELGFETAKNARLQYCK